MQIIFPLNPLLAIRQFTGTIGKLSFRQEANDLFIVR